MISQRAVQKVIEILCRYLSQEDVRNLVRDLRTEVPGNKSFRETINAIWDIVK